MDDDVFEKILLFIRELDQELFINIETQRNILDDSSKTKKVYSSLVTDSLKGLISSPTSLVKNLGNGAKDCLLQERKMDIAGKTANLVEKLKDDKEKEKMRKMFVYAGFELFRSFEKQFMNVNKKRGGWQRALTELAKAAIWCFIRYYVFHDQVEVTEEFILNAFTLKLAEDIKLWNKMWYSGSKTNSKVTDIESKNKWDPVELFSKAGLCIQTDASCAYYINKSTDHKNFGFRRLFSHEQNHLIEIKEKYNVKNVTNVLDYAFKVDMSSETKEKCCEKILNHINEQDEDLMESRLNQNFERITKATMEGLFCDLFQKLKESLDNPQTGPSGTTVYSVSKMCDIQIADSIQNFKDTVFEKPVTINM